MSKQQGYYGAARTFTDALLGGPTTEQQTDSIAVNSTVPGVILVDNNPDRVGLVIINWDTSDCSVQLNPGSVAGTGIRLGQSGGIMSLDVTRDFTLPSRRWYGVQFGAAGTHVTVIEYIRVVKDVL